MEKFIHEAYVARLNQHLHSAHIVKTRCHRSQRKKEDPHVLNNEVANSNGDAAKVSNAKYSRKAVFLRWCYLFGWFSFGMSR